MPDWLKKKKKLLDKRVRRTKEAKTAIKVGPSSWFFFFFAKDLNALCLGANFLIRQLCGLDKPKTFPTVCLKVLTTLVSAGLPKTMPKVFVALRSRLSRLAWSRSWLRIFHVAALRSTLIEVPMEGRRPSDGFPTLVILPEVEIDLNNPDLGTDSVEAVGVRAALAVLAWSRSADVSSGVFKLKVTASVRIEEDLALAAADNRLGLWRAEGRGDLGTRHRTLLHGDEESLAVSGA